MYNDIFAIDEIPFDERQKLDEPVNPYLLKNYSFLGPELDKDIYYKHFLRTSFFDIDIMELENFFKFQYNESHNPNKLIKTIKFKIIPDINEIIKNACAGGNGTVFSDKNEIEFKNGFHKIKGIIKNKDFEVEILKATTAVSKLKQDLKERKSILLKIIKENKKTAESLNQNKLKWIGKPSHLAFIIRTLIDEGYLEAPIKHNNEINLSKLAKQLMNTFQIENGTTENTLMKYLNPNSEKHQALAENFSEQEFHIPDSGLLG